jgi:AcrR family transcriptional regulator
MRRGLPDSRSGLVSRARYPRLGGRGEMARARSALRPADANGARARVDAHGFPRAGTGGHAQIAEIQRARILAAMFDVATERGAGSVSVADVVERSGVSRRTFYEAFTDREDCFLAAFEDALEFVSERVLPAYRGESRWRERIRTGLIALLRFLDEEPVIGRLLVCESLAGGARTLERREQVLAQVTNAVDQGRAQATSAVSLPALTAEGLVGGAVSVIHVRLVQAEREPLVVLTNQLMSMIVLPYLGAAVARRELERPVPASKSAGREATLLSDPFKDAGMRLTYRTVRVLLAIAERPSASNRQVGEGAEINDQGQISKLLGRLQRIGLISNTGLGPGLGAPNAWSLTSKGRELAQSIRVHTQDTNTGGRETR